jgi:hypothetical protein
MHVYTYLFIYNIYVLVRVLTGDENFGEDIEIRQNTPKPIFLVLLLV